MIFPTRTLTGDRARTRPTDRLRVRSRRLPLGILAAFAAIVLVITGCTASELNQGADSSTPPTLPAFTPAPTTTETSEPTPEFVDYSRLLLTEADISDDADTFAPRSSTPNADGLPGASAFFVNTEDTRAITDTIAVYPNAEAATAALRQVTADPEKVATGGTPRPVPVGTDGAVIKGTSPDGGTDVTLLLFTEGPALVQLKFSSAIGDATTDRFVTSIGKMQQIALRVGLTNPE